MRSDRTPTSGFLLFMAVMLGIITVFAWFQKETPREQEDREISRLATVLIFGAIAVGLLLLSELIRFPWGSWMRQPGGLRRLLLASSTVCLGSIGLAAGLYFLFKAPPPQSALALLQTKKIAITASGAGIHVLKVKVQRTSLEDLHVRFSPGMIFVPGDAKVQRMMVMKETLVRLGDGSAREVDVPAACINILKLTPKSEDAFALKESADKDLAALATVVGELDRYQRQSSAVQAAVWIASDDADFEDLKTLRDYRFDFERGRPAVSERDASLAMFLLDRAGIDVTRKNIWADRDELLKSILELESLHPLEESEKWLQQRAKRPGRARLEPLASLLPVPDATPQGPYIPASGEQRLAGKVEFENRTASLARVRLFSPHQSRPEATWDVKGGATGLPARRWTFDPCSRRLGRANRQFRNLQAGPGFSLF